MPSPQPFEWYLGDYKLTAVAHQVRLLSDGLDGIPPRGGENMVVAGREGRHYIDKVHDQRVIGLAMWLKGNSRAELLAARDALCAVLGQSGQQWLYRGLADGGQRQIDVQMLGGVVFQPVSDLVENLVVDFMAAHPYWRAMAANTLNSSGLSVPYAFSVSNGGTAPYMGAVVTITPSGGNLTNPRLTIGSSWVQYTGTVNAGQTLSIDGGAFTASKAGANVANAITSASIDWLRINPGANAASLTGTLSAGTVALSITHYDSWL